MFGQSATQSSKRESSDNQTETGFWQNAEGGRLGQSAAAKTEQEKNGQSSAESTNKKDEDTFKKSSPIDKIFGQNAVNAQPIEDSKEKELIILKPVYTGGNMSFDERAEELSNISFWELSGRIGVTVDSDAYNGSLTWEQENDDLDFRFKGPLGIGGIRIHGTLGEQVRVKTTRGEEFFLTDIEKELEDQLGWQLPISSLRYWVLGITDPNYDTAVEFDENDRITALDQDQWTVNYDDYMQVNGRYLPKKLKVVGPKTKIRLVINDWVANF